MDILDARLKARKAAEEERKRFSHNKYLRLLFNRLSGFTDDFSKNRQEILSLARSKDVINREEFGAYCVSQKKTAVICDEPITFINDFKDLTDSNVAKARFAHKKESFETLNLNKETLNVESELGEMLNGKLWYNSTIYGVNLRPGLLDGEETQPFAVPLDDKAVHGVVVGRTGAGKSVFLNNLVFNMLAEYPPWELDLYLADFKKVEFSRYMNRYHTPHLRACAATSEIGYVVSLIEYLEKSMQARNTLFSKLGAPNIEAFRHDFDVVLPRVVLLVDEFQQLFLEASNKEIGIINDLILSMTKLGRAVGFHLLFASQEMSGALGGNALRNFKARFALPCEADVSYAILGNNAAARLERGEVYVNTESGAESQNRRFRVPRIITDEDIDDVTGEVKQESDFYKFISLIEQYAKLTGFSKVTKYYNEDETDDISILETRYLTDRRFGMYRNEITAKAQYFDVMTLGRSVVFSNRKHELESFFIERGRNKNILVLSPSPADFAYMSRLFAVNFKSSPDDDIKDPRNHKYYALNTIASHLYDISSEENFNIKVLTSPDSLESEYDNFKFRMAVSAALDHAVDFKSFLTAFYTDYVKIAKLPQKPEVYIEGTLKRFADVCDEDLEDAALEEISSGAKSHYAFATLAFARRFYSGVKSGREFVPRIVWICGLEYAEAHKRWLPEVLEKGMDVNILFILMSSTNDDALTKSVISAKTLCNYVFVCGNNPKLYTLGKMAEKHKSPDSIVVDFKSINTNSTRAFKKYKVELAEMPEDSVDYDKFFD